MNQIKPMKAYFSLAVILIHISLNSLLADVNSTEVEILFRKRSHQNPWLVGEPIRQKSSAVSIDSNTYFAITLANEVPLQGEVIDSNRPNRKLIIKKYDPSTGFILLKRQIPLSKNSYNIQFPKSSITCSFKDAKYVQLSFSSIPIRSFRTSEPRNITEFIFKNRRFCGLTLGQYLIPFEYIEVFINSPSISPIPHPGFEFESNLNSSERSIYFPGSRKGILVTVVYPGVGPLNQLIPGDSIYEINGVPLATIPEENMMNRAYDLILRKNGELLKVGSDVRLKFSRMGRDMELRYQLKPYSEDNFLVPSSHPFIEPPYLISGGLFFTELTSAYLKEFGEDYRIKSEKKLLFISEFFTSKQHPHRDRVLILSRVLPHPDTQAYHGFQDLILDSVNDIKIRSIRDLKSVVRSNRSEFIRFHFSGNKEIILGKNELLKIDSDISSTYKIKSLDNIGY